jgi:hypothetical protein
MLSKLRQNEGYCSLSGREVRALYLVFFDFEWKGIKGDRAGILHLVVDNNKMRKINLFVRFVIQNTRLTLRGK